MMDLSSKLLYTDAPLDRICEEVVISSANNNNSVNGISNRFQVHAVSKDKGKNGSPVHNNDRFGVQSLSSDLCNTRSMILPTSRFQVQQTLNARRPSKSVTFHVGSTEEQDAEDEYYNRDNVSRALSQDSNAGTMNVKSFRHVETVERVPIMDHYRNLMSIAGAFSSRPTLTDLHQGEDSKITDDLEFEKLAPDLNAVEPPPTALRNASYVVETRSSGPKFGWIQGVLIRCILNIIGVMLYLRLSWLTGQAGIAVGSLIVLLSCLVTTLTAISMCAISTNGEIRGGGAYFMISRSLGPEFGGSIGIIFAFANAVATAMYIVGFAETLVEILKDNGILIFDAGMNDIRLLGVCTSVLLLCITLIGLSFEAKAQLVLMLILSVSVVNYYIGTVIPPSLDKQAKGVTGYSAKTFEQNFLPAFRHNEGFFSVFAVFFPAATGILAGANISGDLMDPQKSIPKGTLLAIVITSIIYLSCVWLLGATVLRDASGSVEDLLFGNVTVCSFNGSCHYGLMNHAQVMELESGWGPLITAGIFAATLSSALASLVSAPKVFQAVANDKLFPFIHVFARGYGKAKEPRRAYFLTFFVATGVVLIGDLNAIAPIISNFFLAAYALVNYATFDASLAKSPGFRPSFRYYNLWLSMAGAVLCVTVMFIINWWAALVTLGFVGLLYVYVRQRKLDVNWGSSSQAHSYKNALTALQKLQWTEDHVKNYRPQILVLTGNPVARPSLVDFVNNIVKDTSLLICGHVVVVKGPDKVIAEHYMMALQKFRARVLQSLNKRKIKAFYNPVTASSLREGVQSLLQLSGLGRLRVNVVIMGFKSNWRISKPEEVLEYFNIIHDCFDANLAVGILRTHGGFDYGDAMRQLNLEDSRNLRIPNVAFMQDTLKAVDSSPDFVANGDVVNNDVSKTAQKKNCRTHTDSSSSDYWQHLCLESFAPDNNNAPGAPFAQSEFLDVSQQSPKPEREQYSSCPDMALSPVIAETKQVTDEEQTPLQNTVGEKDLLSHIHQFSCPIKKGNIDVWWLFDDGGLSLLVPHLLAIQKSYLQDAKLRVFTVASSKSKLEQEQRSMAALLSKFRIQFSDVTVIPDITRVPSSGKLKEFEELIKELKVSDSDSEKLSCFCITEAELLAQRGKTNRMIRTKELLLEHSTSADLIVVTLPVPRKGACSAALYMCWLEMLTKDMPPTLLLRGNQQSVLTFYS